METCLFGTSRKTPPPLCFLQESSLQNVSMKTRPPPSIWSDQDDQVEWFSVFRLFGYPYLRACQWTVDTWITFDRRNWQDTSFAPNFGLACIWNFVAMFIISSYRYFYIFVYLRFIFFELYICIDIYIYILYLLLIYILIYTDNTNTREHTLITDLNHIVFFVLQGRFRSNWREL